MAMTDSYAANEPTRSDVDALAGPTLIEFGSPWCGYSRAAQPLLAAALAGHPRSASSQDRRRQRATAGAFVQGEALADIGVSARWRRGRTAGSARQRQCDWSSDRTDRCNRRVVTQRVRNAQTASLR